MRLFEPIPFLLSLLERVPGNSIVGFQMNWTEEELQQREFFVEFLESSKVSLPYIEPDVLLNLNDLNRERIIQVVKDRFDDSDICHCFILNDKQIILESYDSLTSNRVDRSITGLEDFEGHFEYRDSGHIDID